VPARRIGTAGGNQLTVQVGWPTPREFNWDVSALYQTWDKVLDSCLA
jgi:hypothetical protein